MNKKQAFAVSCAMAAFLFSTLSAAAQDYSHVTVIDGRIAKVASLATSQAFGGKIPTFATLNVTTVSVIRPNSAYSVSVATQGPNGQERAKYFTIDSASGRVVAVGSINPAAQKPLSLPGTYAAALVLSQPAFEASQSPLKPKGDTDVQLNVPYANLPNIIYVAYMPKGYKNSSPAPLPSKNGTITLGCDPVVSFAVNLLTGAVTTLKPIC